MAAPWTEATSPTTLSCYPLENISNADEFGLFYQCLPNKALHLEEEKCSGRKHSKVCLTRLAVGSANRERLQMFVIGKSVKPRCFKVLKHCLANTMLNINVGCPDSFSKIGYKSWIENLPYLRER